MIPRTEVTGYITEEVVQLFYGSHLLKSGAQLAKGGKPGEIIAAMASRLSDKIGAAASVFSKYSRPVPKDLARIIQVSGGLAAGSGDEPEEFVEILAKNDLAFSVIEDSAKKAKGLIKPQYLSNFSVIEKSIVGEADSIHKSADFAKIRTAYASGQSVVVKFGKRVVQYEPGVPSSGMTMFGENGFLMGIEALSSAAETHKTILHELQRLVTSKSASGVWGDLAAAETKAAFEFTEKAYEAVK